MPAQALRRRAAARRRPLPAACWLAARAFSQTAPLHWAPQAFGWRYEACCVAHVRGTR